MGADREAPARTRKYLMPDFMAGYSTQRSYERWLLRKAVAHCRRDRTRGNESATRELYALEIHRAVCACEGRDAYTGLPLRWDLIGTYDNHASKRGGRAYKKEFRDLPTVDHVSDGMGPAAFRICAWVTNDAKGDLSEAEFVALCRRVVAFQGSGGGAEAVHPFPAPDTTAGARV